MSDIFEELDALVQRHRETETARQREAESAQRFDRIEASIGALGETLSKLASAPTPPPGDGSGSGGEDPSAPPTGGDPPAAPIDPPAPELPVERVVRLDVPRIYNGDDEPAEVSYIDVETGETKKRKGRRKGHPSNLAVEEVELPPPNAAEDPPPVA